MSFLIASAVGAAAGVLASMGLGGGFVLVLYIALFTDIAQKGAQGINLLFFIPITIIAVIIHLKNHMIDVKTALLCSAFGIAAVAGGFYLAQYLDNERLRKIFAIFVICAGARDVFFRGKVDKAEKAQPPGAE